MNWRVVRPIGVAACAAAIVVIAQLVAAGHTIETPLVVTGLTLEAARDLDRTIVEEVYSARLTHTGTAGSVDYARVTASLGHPTGWPVPGFTHVVDGDVTFGAVGAGQTVESTDTITIRRLRARPVRLEQLHWDISSRPDLVLPDDWTGRWRFTVTTKDLDDHIRSVSTLKPDFGVGEPAGFSLLPGFVKCQWNRSGARLDAGCKTRARFAACFIDGSGAFLLERNGELASGGGSWTMTATGDCGAEPTGGGKVEIAGNRVSPDADPDPFSLGLLLSFATDTGFAALIGDGLREAALAPPGSERECRRGGWHRFLPRFHDEHDCHRFFRPAQDTGGGERGER